MEFKTDSKICGVCGDKALGYNFNAVTCESCKAFFRRNALAKKDFRCPFNEQCEITTVTRRFCQKCRLEKCFNIGMRKDYIMSEEDKVLKRKKIEENRAIKRAASNGFKRGFKKVKREHFCELNPQEMANDCDRNTASSDSDNSSEQASYTVSSTERNIISVINYNHNETTNRVYSDETNSYTSEATVSPSDTSVLSPPNDASMLRTILNTTPNGSIKNGEDGSPLLSLINNNESNCNHNTAKQQIRSTTDVTKDVLEDVQR